MYFASLPFPSNPVLRAPIPVVLQLLPVALTNRSRTKTSAHATYIQSRSISTVCLIIPITFSKSTFNNTVDIASPCLKRCGYQLELNCDATSDTARLPLQSFRAVPCRANSHMLCCAPAVPCFTNSHMPCRAPAFLRQCRVLRESPRVDGKPRNANRETPRGRWKNPKLDRSPTGRREA